MNRRWVFCFVFVFNFSFFLFFFFFLLEENFSEKASVLRCSFQSSLMLSVMNNLFIMCHSLSLSSTHGHLEEPVFDPGVFT